MRVFREGFLIIMLVSVVGEGSAFTLSHKEILFGYERTYSKRHIVLTDYVYPLSQSWGYCLSFFEIRVGFLNKVEGRGAFTFYNSLERNHYIYRFGLKGVIYNWHRLSILGVFKYLNGAWHSPLGEFDQENSIQEWGVSLPICYMIESNKKYSLSLQVGPCFSPLEIISQETIIVADEIIHRCFEWKSAERWGVVVGLETKLLNHFILEARAKYIGDLTYSLGIGLSL